MLSVWSEVRTMDGDEYEVVRCVDNRVEDAECVPKKRLLPCRRGTRRRNARREEPDVVSHRGNGSGLESSRRTEAHTRIQKHCGLWTRTLDPSTEASGHEPNSTVRSFQIGGFTVQRFHVSDR